MPARVHAEAKSPHMTAVALASAIAGGIQLITGESPANIAAATSPLVGHVWSVLLLLGGSVVLIGAWIKPVVLGLRLEAAGHIGLASGILVYLGTVVFWLDIVWWVSPAVWWAGLAIVASVVRWWQIWHVMWRVRHV